MDKIFDLAGNVAGGLGILVCLAAGAIRVAGAYQMFGYEAITLFTAGIALMVVGCLAKLQALTTMRL